MFDWQYSFEEEQPVGGGEQARSVRLLSGLLAGTILVTIFTGVGFWLSSGETGVLAIFTIALLAQLPAWLLLRRGRLRPAALVLSSLLWLFFATLSMVQGGIESEQSFGLLVVIILAVLMLGARAGLVFTLLSIGWQFFLNLRLPHLNAMYLLVPEEVWPRTVSISIFFLMGYLLIMLAHRNLRLALQEARDLQERYRSLFEQSNDAVFIRGLELPFRTRANQRAAEMLGYSLDELSELALTDLVAAKDRPLDAAALERLLAGEPLPPYELRLVRKSGDEIEAEINSTLIHDRSGQAVFLQSIVRDITARKGIETRLREIEQRYQALFESTNDAVYLMDLDLVHVAVNPQGAAVLGYRPEEMLGRSALDFIAPEEASNPANIRAALLAGKPVPIYERTMLRKDGSRITAEISAGLVYGKEGQPLYIQSVIRDITWRKKLEDRLTHSLMETEELARTDSLTGLKNRRAVEEYAVTELQRAVREGTALSVMMLDMDHLKSINDTHGHQAGDSALQHFAGLLTSGIRAYDCAGRWAGDEFVLVLPGARVNDAEALAERIRQALATQPVMVAGQPLTLQASIGVAALPEVAASVTLDDLMRWADEALYLAKENGKGGVRLYLPSAGEGGAGTPSP